MKDLSKLTINREYVLKIREFILNNINSTNIIIHIDNLSLFINMFYTLLKVKLEEININNSYTSINSKDLKIIISNSLNHKSIQNFELEDESLSNLESYYIDDNLINTTIKLQKNIISDINILNEFQNIENTEFFLHTSGSTGNPTLIKKSIKDMISEAVFLSNFISNIINNKNEILEKIDNKDLSLTEKFNLINKLYILSKNNEKINSICSIVPHNHMYGLTHNVFLPIVLNTSIIERKPVYENLSLISEDILITSPEFLKNLILMDKNLIPEEIKNIKIIISAGSALSDQVRLSIREISNAIIINTYGSTETGIIAGDIGLGLIPYDSVKIISENNSTFVESNWVSKFKLQDLIEINNKELKLIGRSDRIIKIADKRFNLDRVEQLVNGSELIKDSFAYIMNNRIGVLVELNQNGIELFRNYGKKSIVENIVLNTENEFNKNIRHIKIVSKIYRNNNGKIDLSKNNSQIKSLEHFQYELLEKNENKIIYESKVLIGGFYFQDHFYDFPLVPGFIELDSVIKILGKIGYDFTLIKKISNLKFTAFIRPNDIIKLEIITNKNVVKFIIYSNEEKAASGTISYE